MKWNHWHLMAAYATAALMFLAVACATPSASDAAATEAATTPASDATATETATPPASDATASPIPTPAPATPSPELLAFAEECSTLIHGVAIDATRQELAIHILAKWRQFTPPAALQSWHRAVDDLYAEMAETDVEPDFEDFDNPVILALAVEASKLDGIVIETLQATGCLDG